MMMKKIYKPVLLILCVINLNLFASERDFNMINCPKELFENAKAIVRLDETIFMINSIGKATQKVKYAVSILSKKGDDYATFIQSYDKLRSIDELKIAIYDENGDLIKKVKNSEIKDYSAASGYSLYEDNRVKYYEPIVNIYPYTVVYEYEINYNGLLHYPSWQPINAYNQSVEYSSFTVVTPAYLDFRYKESNIDFKLVLVEDKGMNKYTWETRNMKAIESEPYSPYLYEFTPVVYIAPNNFEIEGYKGNMESWEAMGKWQNQLNAGLDILPDETVEKIRNLVAGESLDIEKAKKIYEYFQNKTRYVNISLGIGGWQPFPAATVDKVGYGDCKALSNYMKALLSSVGIKSHYSLVKAGKDRNIKSDFPSRQSNHIILCVPIHNDTIWLECTDQNIPFGYLGDFTDDRDVLLITENGGKIAHTQKYYQTDNTQFRNATVNLDEMGNGKAVVTTNYKGIQYDNVRPLLNIGREEQQKTLIKSIDLSNFKLDSFTLSEQKNRIPSAELMLDISLSKYASISGNRAFVPLNLLNKMTSIPNEIDKRVTDVILNFAFHDADTITYKIPDHFKVEYKPDNVEFVSEFGSYSATVEIKGNEVVFSRNCKMNKGVFSPLTYASFVEFYKQIVKADKMKLVLIKI